MILFKADNLRIEHDEKEVATLWLDVPGQKHNVLNDAVFSDIENGINALPRGTKALIIVSAKESGFLVGADIKSFGQIRNTKQAEELSSRGQFIFEWFYDLGTATIAAIHGPCLGGGLELALACDSRIALTSPPNFAMGFPELQLGLIPAWGGTQRLPRLIGLENALKLILTGRQVGAEEAEALGLVDYVVPDLKAVYRYLASPQYREVLLVNQSLPSKRTWRQRLLESNSIGRRFILRAARKQLARKVPDDMPAPFEALKAVEFALSDEQKTTGYAYEREAIGRLSQTPACRNLVNLFFMREKARSTVSGGRESPGAESCVEDVSSSGTTHRGADAPRSPIKRVGIVGAGTMGAGIAQLASIKGCQVVVQEVNDQALAAGVNKIEDLFKQAVERKIIPAEESQQKLAALGRTTTWQGFDQLDLVVEAVIEDLDLKRKVFRELEARTRPDCILVTNTSSLTVGQIQEGLSRPERVAALHFFNPVHKMPLVEVVQSRRAGTDAKIIPWLVQLVAALGKTPVVVKDSPGFLVNRILVPYSNEAMLLLDERMYLPDISKVMRRFGMMMGPLEMLDEVGLDVAGHIARAMEPVFGKRLPRNHQLGPMVAAGFFGKKAGLGFYAYDRERRRGNPPPNPDQPSWTEMPVTYYLDRPDAKERMVLLMVNEAAACLGEGIAPDAATIDLAMVLGTGWAPHRGGPLRYADDLGLPQVVKRLEELKCKYGPRFEPCDELRRRTEAGLKFYDYPQVNE